MSKIPTKPKGAEKHLWVLTYSKIAEWVGLESRSVQQYASRGDFEPTNIDSVLTWVNGRRAAAGLRLIGIPAAGETVENPIPPKPPASIADLEARGVAINHQALHDLAEKLGSAQPAVTRIAPIASGGYNPLTGGYDA